MNNRAHLVFTRNISRREDALYTLNFPCFRQIDAGNRSMGVFAVQNPSREQLTAHRNIFNKERFALHMLNRTIVYYLLFQ